MESWRHGYRKLLMVMVVILCLLSFFWYLFAAGVKRSLQDSLAESLSNHVNGRIQIGNIDLSLIGWVRITDVAVYKDKMELLAKVPVVRIQYSWSDLAKGNFDSSRIETIIAEGAEIWLHEEKGQWNWEGFLKQDQPSQNKFQGKLQITSAKIYGVASLASKTIDDVNGIIDLRAFPDLDISLKGKIGQSLSTAEGKWVKGHFARIVVQAKDLNLLEFRDSVPAEQKFTLEGGKLSTVMVTTERDDQDAVKWHVEGEFSGIKLAGKVDVSEGQGQFKGNQDGVKLQNIKLVISGQQTEGQGTLSWPKGAIRIEADLTVPDAAPEAFVSGLAIQRPVVCRIKIVGALVEPDISGSFSFPQINFSDMQVSSVTGNFRVDGSRLLLQGVSGAVDQGTIWVAGVVQRSDGSYELEASGQGLNSSQLTDKDVQGPLDFSAHVGGKGETAVTAGTFIIHNGKAYGIPFLSLTGHFVKRGSITEISGIVMKTAVGTFYPEELSRDVLEYLIGKPGLPKSPEDAIKKGVEGIIKDEVNKLLPRVFH